MFRRVARLGVVVCFALILFPANPAIAVIKVWAGGTGNWTTSANWSPAGAPQDGDDAMLIQADGNDRTVTYNDTSPFLRVYNSIVIDSQGAGRMTLQQVNASTSLEALSLMIGNVGPGTYNLTLGSGSFGAMTLNNGGSLTVGSGAFLNVGTLVQSAGSNMNVPDHFNVNTYRYNGGSFSGSVNAGTFIATGAKFDGFLTINNAMQLPTNFTFGAAVVTHAPYTHAAGRTIGMNSDFVQLGGTFNQSGNFVVGGTGFGAIVIGGGATWNHLAGTSTIGGFQLGTAGTPGTFTIGNGATLTFNKGMSIGLNGDGTLLQSGGRISAGGSLFSRGGEDPVPSRMYWNMSGGTFEHSGDVFFGFPNAISATYIQSNGAFQTARLHINIDSTTYATANISGGTFKVTQNTVNNGSFTVSAGTVDLGATVNGAGTIVVGGGTAELTAARIRQNALSISGNGRVRIESPAGPPATTSRVKSLTIQETGATVNGKLDLMYNRLIVDYDASSPIAAIRRYLKSGRAAGSWGGTGITSTTAALTTPRNTAIGYAESSQLFGSAGGVFGDLFVDDSSVLIKYTYYGDTDLNGIVNFDDYSRVDNSFNNHNGNTWFLGDFDYNGVVNFDDYALIDLGFNTQGAALVRAVPEPSALLFALPLVMSHYLRRRRSDETTATQHATAA